MSRFARILAVTMLAASGLLAAILPASASVTTCKTTDTHTHTVTSAGTVTDRWETRYACGKDYRMSERVISQSRTGAHYTESVTRNEMSYPHYSQTTVKDSWSAKGTYKHTVTTVNG